MTGLSLGQIVIVMILSAAAVAGIVYFVMLLYWLWTRR